MRDLIRIAKTSLPGWNKRVLTEEDFYRYCTDLEVQVVERETASLGEYTVFRNVHFIILDPSLKRGWRLWVAMHELGHRILHAPLTSHFSYSTVKKFDYQANTIAAVALIPTYLCETKTLGELQEEFGYPNELIAFRKELYDTRRF